MSKKYRNRNNNKREDTRSAAPSPPAAPSSRLGAVTPTVTAPSTIGALIEEAQSLSNFALGGATEAEVNDAAKLEVPSRPTEDDLRGAVKQAQEAFLMLSAQERRAREATAAAEESRTTSEKERLQLVADREALQRERTVAAAELEAAQRASTDARKNEVALGHLEQNLRERELNAEAGFAAQRRESLRQLDREAAALREEMSNARTTIARERATWEEERRQEQAALNKALHQKRNEVEVELAGLRFAAEQEIADGRVALAADRAQLKKAAAALDVDRELLGEDREAFEVSIERRVAAKLEGMEGQIKDLEERLATARQERDRLFELHRQREEAERQLGHRTPEEVATELSRLTRERDALKAAIATRAPATALARLEELERHKEEWETERQALTREVMELRNSLGRSTIAVTELETLRDQKAALESGRDLLQAALEELRKDVNERIRRSDGVSPFPACSQMDSTAELQTRSSLEDSSIDLAGFAKDLQQRIAYDPMTEKELFYSLHDIRCFLGGLAMSRLHLLQGISGTGKTSLPLAFARAIGAGITLVEVQAGWRDRQDLIGHFNAFERRFYESEFLQALYRAQCPKYAEAPYVIVLDEMNLSHPEQYFADLLSALEQDRHLQKLDLMTAPVDPAPARLSGGRTLMIPENVWFIGTANHDETTKDFADKTYDRAHIMELPRHREEFRPARLQARSPIAYEALVTAFLRAKEKHEEVAKKAYAFLDREFADILGRRFRIGWGNRLERQIEDFLPVVVAAGGSAGEAIDHLLATKLLRKVRDRHDIRPDDVLALRRRVEEAWPQVDKAARPERSLAILQAELLRLGVDEEA